MSVHIVTGLPGAGKSYETARINVWLLYRNRNWFEKTGIIRQVATNLKMSEEIEKEFGYGTENNFLRYWDSAEELPDMRNVDITWEEMGVYVDARQWENLTMEFRSWLMQHRHYGCEIWGNVQEFADVDIAVRRLTEDLIYLTKIWGSREPSTTTPPVTRVWGIVSKRRLDPRNYKEDMKFETGKSTWAGFMWISGKVAKYYNTHNNIKVGLLPKLQHRTRLCGTCGYVKTIHI